MKESHITLELSVIVRIGHLQGHVKDESGTRHCLYFYLKRTYGLIYFLS